MRHWKMLLYLIAVIGIVGFFLYASLPKGMVSPGTLSSAEVSQTVTPFLPAAAVAQITDEAVEVSDAPAEDPTQTEMAPAEQVNYCIECHTDKDELVDTAAPEQEVVEESEGAG